MDGIDPPGGDVQEVAVTNPALAGSTIAELDAHLPEQVLIVMVGTEVTAHLSNRDETVESGDHVTLIGSQSTLSTAMRDLENDESRQTGPPL